MKITILARGQHKKCLKGGLNARFYRIPVGTLLFAFLCLTANTSLSQRVQGAFAVEGKVLNAQTGTSLGPYTVSIEGSWVSKKIEANTRFRLETSLTGEQLLRISAPDFVTKRIPIVLEQQVLDLGTIYLERDIALDKTDNLISLTDAELYEEENGSTVSGLLQASRDIFLTRAAFDFGQAFFKVRGYDRGNGTVLINGIRMNTFYDRRAQWNTWGGLNDVTRNQDFSNGLEASDHTFGGILGTTQIDTRPSAMRPGVRISYSASNRTYRGRAMITYNSGNRDSGFSYSVSASKRWASEGYISGTLYDADSFFGAVEYHIDPKNSVSFTSLLASNRRGRSSAITEEVFNLAGKKYNPFWGFQQGDMQNSRERRIEQPLLMLNYFHRSDRLRLSTGIAYQYGPDARSRIGYYNAPNPDPTYYRYLPSFYINGPTGANFENAKLAKEGFLNNPQLNWGKLYRANIEEDTASYVWYDDTIQNELLTANGRANLKVGEGVQLDFGATYRTLKAKNFAVLRDLMGAEFHEDIDPFSGTRNDLNGTLAKEKGEVFNYNYLIHADAFDAFLQFRMNGNTWGLFLSGNYAKTGYQREGLFLNERFLEGSLGPGGMVDFSNYGAKGGFSYSINGRHRIKIHGAYLTRNPAFRNVFINPRENNHTVPNLQNEKISTVDCNYYVRLPKLTGRITGFYTRFQDLTDINFFFVESGVGSDFVQEVLSGLDKLHLGTELGMEYKMSSSVKVSAVAAIGKYVYARDPSLTINFDTAGSEDDQINAVGNLDLGKAKIKDLKLAQGPQKAYALGLEYRDPKYWWVGGIANYLANNYGQISFINRTGSFFIDPETGRSFPQATQENVDALLTQRKMEDCYLLNVIGGKSWLVGNKYVSLFASINNVFDTTFKTGGFEQRRKGNFGELWQDRLSGNPSFGPKYWYGYGRTYFINLAISF